MNRKLYIALIITLLNRTSDDEDLFGQPIYKYEKDPVVSKLLEEMKAMKRDYEAKREMII